MASNKPTYAIIDGKLVAGRINYKLAIGKLTGIPTGGPAQKRYLDKRDPNTGLWFRWEYPYRPPTPDEIELWENDTFRYDSYEVFLKDIEVLDTESVYCANCEKQADGVCGDYLCVECRYRNRFGNDAP